MVLVELCAGTAALSAWLLARSKPLTGYAGGKGRWASRLAMHLEADTPDRVILCDAGPWGRVWSELPEHWEAVAAALEALCLDDPETGAPPPHPRDVWDEIKAQPVPEEVLPFLARFLTLQRLNFRSKPVGVKGGKWVTHGYSKSRGEGEDPIGGWGAVKPQLPALPPLLRALGPHLGRVEGHHCSALDLRPPAYVDPSSVLVYIDPPYQGTTGYGPHDLTRAQVLELADRWMAWGARVAISEAEPIPGWRAIRLGEQSASSGLSGTSEGRVEWLSVAWRARQLGLFSG